ncbi:MAG: HAMP domain-containing sensor histidine kinase [Bacteroidota bacterium]|nr:HAMP domain-containing sensor histidine kinase [Bacteroidota bacterium]
MDSTNSTYKDDSELNRLAKKITELNQLNLSHDKFLSLLAHDLRGPVSNMVQLSLLMNEPAMRDDDVVKMLQVSADKTLNLLDDLLAWVKSKQGILKPNISSFVFKQLIDEELAHVEYSSSVKKIAIKYNSDDTLLLNADKNMIGTVMRNLLGNAIKYSQSNSVVEILYNSNDNDHIISIKDQGVGFSDAVGSILLTEHMPTSEGTAGEVGTGWGLLLCKDFVELHQGKIWFESTPGVGSIFSFSIPKRLAA